MLDALLERSRPAGRRRRKRISSTTRKTTNNLALQTWLLFLVLITMGQVVLLSHWAPSIIMTKNNHNNNSTRTGSGADNGMISMMMNRRSNITTENGLSSNDHIARVVTSDTEKGGSNDGNGSGDERLALEKEHDDSMERNTATETEQSASYSHDENGTEATIKETAGKSGRSSNMKGIPTVEGESSNDTSTSQAPIVKNEQLVVPLDNFYSRQHITNDEDKPILVVGGSDGSGTRAFVDMLVRMGVPFVMDELGTMDVHGAQMFHGQGWPPLVKMVLQATHSANYELHDLPIQVRQKAIQELEKLKEHLQLNATLSKWEETDNKEDWSKFVNFGFKAPVTMLLLPLLRHVFGPIKFLHVVRDGRDMALSNNKSPVIKFYDTFYTDSTERRAKLADPSLGILTSQMDNVLSMQLWNDWNAQVLNWEHNHANGKSFDFLIVRTEDFVYPETKYQSLLQLSDFVGSYKTDEELCCMSREIVQDLGKSGRTAAKRYQRVEQEKKQQATLQKPRGEEGDNSLGLFIDTLRQEEKTLDEFASTLENELESIQKMTKILREQEDIIEQEMERIKHVDNNDEILDLVFYLFDHMSGEQRHVHSRGYHDNDSNQNEAFSDILDRLTNHNSLRGKDRGKLLGIPSRTEHVRKPSKDRFVHNEDRYKDEMLGEILDALKRPKRKHVRPVRVRDVDDDYAERRPMHAPRRLTSVSGGNHAIEMAIIPAQQAESAWTKSPLAPDTREGATAGFLNNDRGNNDDNIPQEHAQRPSKLQTTEPAMRQQHFEQEEKQRQGQLKFTQLLERKMRQREQIQADREKRRPKRDHSKAINSRYGKWKAALKNRPELSALLHSEGAKGLELFGYEPPVRFSDKQSSRTCKCDESVICPGKEPESPNQSSQQSQVHSDESLVDASDRLQQDQIEKGLQRPQPQVQHALQYQSEQEEGLIQHIRDFQHD